MPDERLWKKLKKIEKKLRKRSRRRARLRSTSSSSSESIVQPQPEEENTPERVVEEEHTGMLCGNFKNFRWMTKISFG